MKYLSLFIILGCLSLQQGFSQVKKKFQDNKHAETTVVVKEDNAKDVDILNSQFNLNDLGMGEVIMIKTEKLKPKGAPAKKPEVKNPTPKPTKVVQAKVTPKEKVVVEKTPPAPKAAAEPKVERSRSYASSSSSSSTAKKKKYKRVKLKKRKKLKKHGRHSCYRF